MKRLLFATPVTALLPSLGLLLFRLFFGAFMLLGHGWGKLMSFGEASATFPDPLHIGSKLSMGSAVFCEVFCAALVVLGLVTRLAVIPLVFTMGVAAFIVHGGDALAVKEMALMYLAAFALLLFTGPGVFSLDAAIEKRK